ncbi:MAG: hypothetical protein JNG84_00250 [Archangium sp.]|nr:hypothetical protein [Archangium sp.]
MNRFALAAALLASTAALAFHPTLSNQDSKKYEMEIECGSSTLHTSIGSNTSTSLPHEGCKLRVKGAGSAKLAADMKCVIKNSMLDCD